MCLSSLERGSSPSPQKEETEKRYCSSHFCFAYVYNVALFFFLAWINTLHLRCSVWAERVGQGEGLTQGVPASYDELNHMQQHPIRGRYQPTCSTTQHGWTGEEHILLCRYDVGSFHCPWWASTMLFFKCHRWLLLYGMCKAKPNVEDVPDHTIQTKTNSSVHHKSYPYPYSPILLFWVLFSHVIQSWQQCMWLHLCVN